MISVASYTLVVVGLGIALLLSSAGFAAAAAPNTLFSSNSHNHEEEGADRHHVLTKEAMGARCAVSADFDGDGRLGEFYCLGNIIYCMRCRQVSVRGGGNVFHHTSRDTLIEI